MNIVNVFKNAKYSSELKYEILVKTNIFQFFFRL